MNLDASKLMDSAEESADMPGTVGIALCHMADCIVTNLAGESVHTGRGLIAAADAETPATRLIKLVEPHLATL